MKFEKFLRMVGPMVAMAAMAGLNGCNGESRVNDSEGVPLSELDLTGKAPEKLILMGADDVRVTAGKTLKIKLEGSESAKAKMRFVLDDDALAVMREGGITASTGHVTVHVTMPAPREIVVGGSGTVHASALAKNAEIAIGGSGSLIAPKVALDSLEISIAGSGNVRAGGTVRDLDVTLAGSGDADLGELKAGRAEIAIAGSGSATLASDGEVEASIMGSGNVTVRGSARCRVKNFGTGTLTCERAAEPVG